MSKNVNTEVLEKLTKSDGEIDEKYDGNQDYFVDFPVNNRKDLESDLSVTRNVRFSPLWKQSFAASAPILLNFASGLTSGFSGILLPQLKNETGTIPADEDTASWIASVAALPMIPGCLISGWIFEKYGRRTAQMIVCIPFFVGWVLIAASNSLNLMLCGRLLTGLCTGLISPLGPVYVGETTEPKYRGFFLCAIALGIAFGMMFVHIVGIFISWHWTAAISSLFPILCVIILVFVPESPTWLISKNRFAEGTEVYYYLRGYSDESKMELKSIIASKLAADTAPRETWREKLLYFKSPELIKPLFIMILFFATCQFSGTNAVAFYSTVVIQKAVGGGVDENMAMLVIDLLRTIASAVACVICKKYGRRPSFFASGGFTSLSLLGLAIYLYLKPENMSWVPISCLVLYICAISIGIDPLPWMMCGEVFPTKVRGSGISTALAYVCFFVVVKTAPGMMTDYGEVFTFAFYGAVTFLGTLILFFSLPETKGKTLQEIEDKFNRK